MSFDVFCVSTIVFFLGGGTQLLTDTNTSMFPLINNAKQVYKRATCLEMSNYHGKILILSDTFQHMKIQPLIMWFSYVRRCLVSNPLFWKVPAQKHGLMAQDIIMNKLQDELTNHVHMCWDISRFQHFEHQNWLIRVFRCVNNPKLTWSFTFSMPIALSQFITIHHPKLSNFTSFATNLCPKTSKPERLLFFRVSGQVCGGCSQWWSGFQCCGGHSESTPQKWFDFEVQNEQI